MPDPAHVSVAGPWTITVSNGVATLTASTSASLTGGTVTVVGQRRYAPTISTQRATPVIIVTGSNLGSESDVATVANARPNTAGSVTIKVWNRTTASYVTGLTATVNITTDATGAWTGTIGPIANIPAGQLRVRRDAHDERWYVGDSQPGDEP